MFLTLNKFLGGAIAACLTFILGLWVMNAHLRAELAEARADKAAFMAANDEFKGRVEHQNAAIAKLQAETEERRRAALKAARDAQAVATQYAVEADKLSRAEAQGDQCAAADKLLSDYLRRPK